MFDVKQFRAGIVLMRRGIETDAGIEEEDKTKFLARLSEAEKLADEEKGEEGCKIALNVGRDAEQYPLRLGLKTFREANEIQSKNLRYAEHTEFFAFASTMLDEAEKLLDEDKMENARALLIRYFKEKVKRGLAGPTL